MNKTTPQFRKATYDDLPAIIHLLTDDVLGQTRQSTDPHDPRYDAAFKAICADSNQYLMVAEQQSKVIGTCHLTIIPSLTFTGATRLQIEAVRVAQAYRNKNIGEQMIMAAINYGKTKNATIIQLTTNKTRLKAKAFYENLGFVSTHEGMKLTLSG